MHTRSKVNIGWNDLAPLQNRRKLSGGELVLGLIGSVIFGEFCYRLLWCFRLQGRRISLNGYIRGKDISLQRIRCSGWTNDSRCEVISTQEENKSILPIHQTFCGATYTMPLAPHWDCFEIPRRCNSPPSPSTPQRTKWHPCWRKINHSRKNYSGFGKCLTRYNAQPSSIVQSLCIDNLAHVSIWPNNL